MIGNALNPSPNSQPTFDSFLEFARHGRLMTLGTSKVTVIVRQATCGFLRTIEFDREWKGHELGKHEKEENVYVHFRCVEYCLR